MYATHWHRPLVQTLQQRSSSTPLALMCAILSAWRMSWRRCSWDPMGGMSSLTAACSMLSGRPVHRAACLKAAKVLWLSAAAALQCLFHKLPPSPYNRAGTVHLSRGSLRPPAESCTLPVGACHPLTAGSCMLKDARCLQGAPGTSPICRPCSGCLRGSLMVMSPSLAGNSAVLTPPCCLQGPAICHGVHGGQPG